MDSNQRVTNVDRLHVHWRMGLKMLSSAGAYLAVVPLNNWSGTLVADEPPWTLLVIGQSLGDLEPLLPSIDRLLAFKAQQVLNLLGDGIWGSWLAKFRVFKDRDDELSDYCFSEGLTGTAFILSGWLTGVPEEELRLQVQLFLLDW